MARCRVRMATENQDMLQMMVGDEFSFGIDVKDLLECPVCLRTVYDAPIYRCENDHIMCKTCHERLLSQGGRCPFCRSNTLASDKRSRILEAICARFPKTECKHPGCTHAMTDPYDLGIHEGTECSHRPHPCPLCTEPVRMSGMHQHLNANHFETVGTYGTRMKLACNQALEEGTHVIRMSDEDSSNQQTFTLHFKDGIKYVGSPCLAAWVAQDSLKNAGNFDSEYEFTLALASTDGSGGGELMSISAHCSPSDVEQGIACLYLSPHTIKEATTDMGYHVIYITVNRKGLRSGNEGKAGARKNHRPGPI